MTNPRIAYVFEEGVNPSSDYYIIPLLNIKGFDVRRIHTYKDEFPEIEYDSYVFIVRYLTQRLVKHIKFYRKRIKKLIYFMDDGLWDLKSISSVPLAYAWRLFKKAYIYRWSVLELKAELWVSTDYLREKYGNYSPKLIIPYPLGLEKQEVSQGDHKVVFYHGTSSHKEEIEWLAEVFNILSQKIPDILLEIILDEKNWKKFRNIRNVVAMRPMSWQTFLKFSSLKYRKVGLVPLFPKEFNRGRSWIKFYDITRSGAVGIYSEHAPYSEHIKNFQTGLVLPMDEKEWVLAVENLIKDEEFRRNIFNNSRTMVEYFKEIFLSTQI
ncbi:hypothetical protein [Thermocrinis sp.]